MANQPTLANWLSILALGLIWGGTFMVVSIALQGYGPITVACARTTLGALALLTLTLAMRRPWPQWTPSLMRYMLAIGLVNTAIPFTLLSWGQQFVPSAFAGLSMAALPLFVLPMAHVFSDERMSWRAAVGVALGFCGAVVLIGPGLLRIGAGVQVWGQMACLAAAASYAVGSIMTRNCPPIDSLVMATITLAIGAVTLIPATLWIEGMPGLASPRLTLAILFLGLFPTALAALIRVTVIRSAGSVFMTLVNYQVPLWATFFGALVLNETLGLRFFTALSLILAGLAFSQWPTLRRLIRQL